MRKIALSFVTVFLVLVCLLPLAGGDTGLRPYADAEEALRVSDHFDGIRYFNPDAHQGPPASSGQAARWIWNWIFRTNWPKWPKHADSGPGAPPVARAADGSLYITPVGHGTFLIQMDGINILTDPIWSERCSPVSWLGPKRHHRPGIPFEDLPPIDVVLVSHNHYDHFDVPTLKRLAENGVPRSIVPLGNLDLVRSTGIPTVDELDWWQSVRLSPNVTVTLVPAQHFSSRTLWDRNRTLWGGFVISGPSGNVYYAGDTGYGPHFSEIARRFSPIRAALLPIAPFRPPQASDSAHAFRSVVHMGPAHAVQAHIDLETPLSIAAHYQVFQLGVEGFDDAADMLMSSLKEHNLTSDAFLLPVLGQAIELPADLIASLRRTEEPLWIDWMTWGSCLPATPACRPTIPAPGAVSAQSSVSSGASLW